MISYHSWRHTTATNLEDGDDDDGFNDIHDNNNDFHARLVGKHLLSFSLSLAYTNTDPLFRIYRTNLNHKPTCWWK